MGGALLAHAMQRVFEHSRLRTVTSEISEPQQPRRLHVLRLYLRVRDVPHSVQGPVFIREEPWGSLLHRQPS